MLPRLIISLSNILGFALSFLTIVIFASVAISWLNAPSSNPIVQIIHSITEPLYRPVRRFTSRIPGPLDWAPIAIIMIIYLIQSVVVPELRDFGIALQSQP